MIGQEATIKDIELDLDALVSPANLLCDEEVIPEEALEVEPGTPFRVETRCNTCETRLRLHVVATDFGIRQFQTLLLGQLSLLCPACSRHVLQHGRQ